MEDRTLLSVSPLFDAPSGILTLRGDAGDNTIRETVSPGGFLELTCDGQLHSSDPASASFDQALAGASAGSLAGLSLDGRGGSDTLILGRQMLAGGLRVSAAGATVVTQDVAAAGPVAIVAQAVTIRGTLRGSSIALDASGLVTVAAAGSVTSTRGNSSGKIDVAAGVFVNSGQLHADGGQLLVHSAKVLEAGRLTADGGGSVRVEFTDSYIDTTAAVASASGGSVTIDGGGTGRLFSSGSFRATGPNGGSVDLFGREVVLDGATVDASGEAGGGSVRVGGDFQGRTVGPVFNRPGVGGQVANLPHSNAQTVTVTGATTLWADALGQGNGGRVIVWADQQTTFAGSVSARGGAGGVGGFIEVSAKGQLNYSGSADAGAPHGTAGTLLLDPKNLVISAAPAGVLPQFDLIDPHPMAGGGFGTQLAVLSTGNVVVTNPNDDFGGTSAGAVYLFNGLTGALLSSLVGSTANDRVGSSGISTLSNGNYVVVSPLWNGNRGAVTWASGTAGVSGVVSEANSLVGSSSGDQLGGGTSGGISSLLSNSNYLVISRQWNGQRGAITWGSGTAGVSGIVSDANSLVGSDPGDLLFSNIDRLSNGNYVILSPNWNGNRGAATWVNGATGQTLDGSGIISEGNSLVGSNPGDQVGSFLVGLTNGNYVVSSHHWNGNRGAATWFDGTAGLRGVVSDANSLVGSSPGDRVGFDLFPLSNGNYVVNSPSWNDNRGAVTWGDGTIGVTGTVDASNSLVGSNAGDQVGSSGISTLSNGNYVVLSPLWNGNRGAVTWGDGTVGIRGVVSEANSLVGTSAGDQMGSHYAVLSNGNYVLGSPSWNGDRGAVTWGDGTVGVRGIVSEANSLVGSDPNDRLGVNLAVLSNGNYVLGSPSWSGNRGAATWVNGTTGQTLDGLGTISDANSLVGGDAGDQVGINLAGLSNGNYLVRSTWNDNRGAVTWGDGTLGVHGTASEGNSLVGSNPNDQVGFTFTRLSNGNYVVQSPSWNGNRGAATWGDGMAGVRGVVSEANSLVGSDPGDQVGSSLTTLSNGNYVVGSRNWNGNRGAVTWGDRSTGVRGIVSEANSLVGSDPGDQVGSSLTTLSNGNYVVRSPNWNGNRGAATWGDGSTGVHGVVSEANSLVGSDPGDQVGSTVIASLTNGNYVVRSPNWNGNRGAATWGDGTAGVRGVVSDANSLVGSNPGDQVGSSLTTLSNGNYVVLSPNWNGARGAATWVNGTTGQTLDGRSTITPPNSLVGTADNAGLGSIVENRVTQTFLARFVTEGGGRVTAGLADPNLLTYCLAQGQTLMITPDFLTRTLNTGTAVVLQASNDITINDPITVSAGGHGGALTLQAGRSILINAAITTDNGDLTLIANDTLANGVVDAERDPGPAVITMADGTNIDTGSGALTIELHDGAGRTNTDSGAITLQTVTAGSVSVANHGPSAGSDIVLGPVTTAGAQSYANPNGTTLVTGDLTAADSPVTFTDAVILNAGLTLSAGSGSVNFAGGVVVSPGVLTVAGGVVLSDSATFSATLNGTDPDNYSQVTASGPVDLGGSTLSLTLGFTPELGDAFTLLSSDTGPITGTFAGLDEGAVFSQDGMSFQITYQGGPNGNSVVLTRVG
jgi:hypothetical protein